MQSCTNKLIQSTTLPEVLLLNQCVVIIIKCTTRTFNGPREPDIFVFPRHILHLFNVELSDNCNNVKYVYYASSDNRVTITSYFIVGLHTTSTHHSTSVLLCIQCVLKLWGTNTLNILSCHVLYTIDKGTRHHAASDVTRSTTETKSTPSCVQGD